jgi:hypothetical protein
MLYDSISVQEVVDSASAHEFLKQATQLASSGALEDTGRRLEQKARTVQEFLAPRALDALGAEGLKRLAGMMFGMRRQMALLLRGNDIADLRAEIAELVHGAGAGSARLGRFVERVHGIEQGWKVTLAAELLHYAQPSRYWLCSRWMWDPATRGGALPLVLQQGADLGGATPAEEYENVGRAVAMVNAAGHAQGFADLGPGLFGTNVFLACVYAVYMYTVFRMKLSQEFNRILPELPELTRRILGVQRVEVE